MQIGFEKTKKKSIRNSSHDKFVVVIETTNKSSTCTDANKSSIHLTQNRMKLLNSNWVHTKYD